MVLTRTAPVLALALTASCAAVTLDLSNIEEPVMLSPVPAGAAYGVRPIADFRTQVSHATGGASGGAGGSRSTQILEDPAQVAAFEAVGGFAERMILVDEVEVWGGGGNLLIVYAELSNVVLSGESVERTPVGGGEGGGE